MMVLAVFGAISALCMPLFAAKTLYVVPPDTPGTTPTSPYGSWETAATNIADAIAAAAANWGDVTTSTGDTILVAPGTYDVASTITMDKRLLTIKSVNRETGEEDRENTILDGGGTTSIMKITATYVSISGLTFANGFSTNETVSMTGYSAGVYITAAYSMISNCVFRGNTSFNTAGTCINDNYKVGPIISGCTFTNNTQIFTAGTINYNRGVSGCAIRIHIADSVPANEADYGKIENCYFADNKTSGKHVWGGVVWANYTTLDNCTFKGNEFTATEEYDVEKDILSGFSVILSDGCPAMKNCRFSGRVAYPGEQYTYGSLLAIGSQDCIISNCTFSGINAVSGDREYGMVYVNKTGVKLVDCSFTNIVYDGIKSLWGMGLIYQTDKGGNLLLRNCLIGNNTISNRVGYIRQTTITAYPVGFSLENCTLVDNELEKYNSGKFVTQTASTCTNYMANCVFVARVGFSAPAIASNCCFKTPPSSYQVPSGNITTNNCFHVDTLDGFKFVDYANGDYRLQRKSPLCDRGMMLDWMTAGATDLDGNERVHLNLPDIGCYECQLNPPGFIMVFR